MKKILVLMVMVSAVKAQSRDNIWQLGHVNVGTGKSYYLDFSSGAVDTIVLERTLKFFITDASICDTSGQLLFYTNGVWVANRNHDTLLNSQDYNPGYWTDFYGDDGMGIPQGCLFLPILNSDSLYWLFHVSGEYGNFYNQTFSTVRLGASLIDSHLDSGLGGMVESSKNITVIADTLEWGRLTACKHANGRDWWIITHKFHSDKYYKILLLPDTMKIYTQEIGNIFDTYNPDGMAVFVPDGSKYAHLNINDTIDLLQFDRCTGEFSNFIKLSVPDTSTLSATLSCSFSPSSRFLYISTYYSLYQFDTWANDIQASIIKVGAWVDQAGWPDWFYLHQTARDGKIYISIWNSDHWMHVINNPDSLGLSCNFVQGDLILPPVASNSSIPNFPNYDLGPLIGSPCDTLSIPLQTFQPQTPTFHFSPNPASSYINIVYSTTDNATLTLTNTYGIAVKQLTLYPYFKNRIIYVDDLAEGIYLVTLKEANQLASKKLIIQR